MFMSLLAYFPWHTTGRFDLFVTRCIYEFAEAITEDELKARRDCPLFCDGKF
jgi:hypothetical protein